MSVGANSSVSDDTNGHTGSETSQTDRDSGSEVSKSLVGGVIIADDCREGKQKGQRMPSREIGAPQSKKKALRIETIFSSCPATSFSFPYLLGSIFQTENADFHNKSACTH